jgi:hypothetical protein
MTWNRSSKRAIDCQLRLIVRGTTGPGWCFRAFDTNPSSHGSLTSLLGMGAKPYGRYCYRRKMADASTQMDSINEWRRDGMNSCSR